MENHECKKSLEQQNEALIKENRILQRKIRELKEHLRGANIRIDLLESEVRELTWFQIHNEN